MLVLGDVTPWLCNVRMFGKSISAMNEGYRLRATGLCNAEGSRQDATQFTGTAASKVPLTALGG
jgi:hypothetical protein